MLDIDSRTEPSPYQPDGEEVREPHGHVQVPFWKARH